MRFVTYNIQYGLGMDGRYDLARIADAVRDADIIALQEVDRYWQRSGMVDSPAVLAENLPDHYWVYAPNYDMDASTRENGRPVNRRRQFGTMVLARQPVLSMRNFALPKRALTGQHSIQQGVQEAVVGGEGMLPVRVYCTHLSHLSEHTRLPQIELILDVIARASGEGGAWCGTHPDPSAGWTEGGVPPMPREVILAGDMNFTPASVEYDRLVGPPTEKYGRLVSSDGLVDAWVAAGNAESEGRTHQGDSRIDHVFVSASLAGCVRSASIDHTANGSDHYPLWVEFDWPTA